LEDPPTDPVVEPAVGAGAAPQTETFELGGGAAEAPRGRESWLGPLILVPLGLVSAALGLFLFMTWMMGDQTGPEDYVEQIASGGYNASKQAFYGLVTELLEYRDSGRLDELPADFDVRIAAAYDRLPADRTMQRVALAQALVMLRSDEAFDRALGLLDEGLASGGAVPANTPLESLGVVETRHLDPLTQGVLMLGQLGDLRATDRLTDLLEHEDSGVRMLAAASLGGLPALADMEPLRRALGDGDRDVRRNAAVALARHADDSGLSVLLEMLNLGSYQGYSGEQSSQAMLWSLQALASLRSDAARPAIEAIVSARRDYPPGVASAAMRWLEAADAGWPAE